MRNGLLTSSKLERDGDILDLSHDGIDLKVPSQAWA